MGMTKLEEIVEKLLKGGMSPDIPSAVVSNGTLPSQKKIISSLKELVSATKSAGLEHLQLFLLETQLDGQEKRQTGLKRDLCLVAGSYSLDRPAKLASLKEN